MRLLLYGLQNSGATLLALLAGQRPGSIVLPDLWTMHAAPEISDRYDVCVKATVTTAFPLERHVERFRPDLVVMVVRRPVDNLLSLRHKSYAGHDGTLEEKFAIADGHFAERDGIDLVLHFEDVVDAADQLTEPLAAVGWVLPTDATRFPRRPVDMERTIWRRMPELYADVQWGTGEARLDPLASIRLGSASNDEAAIFCSRHAPQLHKYYESRPGVSGRIPVTRTAQDDAALQSLSGFVTGQLALCESAVRSGLLAEAEEITADLIRLAPDRGEVWGARARVLEALGCAGSARDELEIAVEAASTKDARRELLTARARQELRLGNPHGCLEISERIVAEWPGDAGALHGLADACVRLGRAEEGRGYIEQLLERDPRNVQALLVLANAWLALGSVADAVDALLQCLAIAPNFQPAIRKLAELSG